MYTVKHKNMVVNLCQLYQILTDFPKILALLDSAINVQ